MSDARKAARAQLRRDVALMRTLGVARWKREEEEIFLGPPPAAPAREMSVEDQIAHRNREAIMRHDTLFAATSTRPIIPEMMQTDRASVLKSVVPRQPPQEHDLGPQKQG